MDVNILEVYSFMEVSSFQGVGIEEFHCIQRYPHFREKFTIQRYLHFRELDRGVPLYTEVSSFQGVRTERYFTIFSNMYHT